MPNFELMLWIILAFWVFSGITDIIAGIVLHGEPKTYSLGTTVEGIVLILLVIVVLTVV